MKDKIIFWGHVNTGDRVHLVSWDGETGSQYHKIDGTLIEYAVVATYEQLKEELRTKRPVILCVEHDMELDWDTIIPKCQKIIFMPEMNSHSTDDLIRTALFSNKCYVKKQKMMLAGMEGSADHIALQVLKHFKIVEKAKAFQLLIGGTSHMEVDEISKIEDVMRDYASDGSCFSIDQIPLKEKNSDYYFLLYCTE